MAMIASTLLIICGIILIIIGIFDKEKEGIISGILVVIAGLLTMTIK